MEIYSRIGAKIEDAYKARRQARGRLQRERLEARGRLQRGRLQARGRLQRGIFGQKHVILNVQGHHLLLTPHTKFSYLKGPKSSDETNNIRSP